MPMSAAPDVVTPLSWLHVPRAVGIALDPRKLFLGALGLMLLRGGNLLISQLPFGSPQVHRAVTLSGLSQWQHL